MAEKIYWTNSRLSAWQDCPRKEAYRFRDQIVPMGGSSIAQCIGRAVHKGIETWSVDEGMASLDMGYPTTMEEVEQMEVATATTRAMLEGYLARFEPFEIHNPEMEFLIGARYPTKKGLRRSNRVMLAGKIDDIAVIDGQEWLVEYKTAGQIDKAYFDRLYVDSQISFYMMAAKRIGYKPVGVIYRVIKKPSIRVRKDETITAFTERLIKDYKERPDFYFHEERLYRADDDLEAFEIDLWKEIKQAEKNASEGFLARHSHACSNWGSCPYLPLCMGEAGAENMYTQERPFRELDIMAAVGI